MHQHACTEEQMQRRIAWVEALRSGKYLQGSGCLRGTDNTFCCLGVGIDVVDPNNWLDGSSADSKEGGFAKADAYLHRGLFSLPHEDFMRDEYGLDHDPLVEFFDETQNCKSETYLSRLNDVHNFSFRQIADVIEANFITDVETV